MAGSIGNLSVFIDILFWFVVLGKHSVVIFISVSLIRFDCHIMQL